MLKTDTPIADLSPRENQIARRYVSGLSHTEIAEELYVAPSTVRTHISSIFRKMEVSNKLELLRAIEARDEEHSDYRDLGATGVERAQPHPLSRTLLLAIIACLAAALIGISVWMSRPQPEDQRQGSNAFDGPSIAVMPIDVEGASEEDRATLSAINRDIVTDLSQFSGIAVIAAGTTFRPEFVGQPARSVGEELGVRYVLAGAATWVENLLAVDLHLMEVETSQIVWSERFETTRDHLLEFQTDVSTRVIGMIGPVETGAGHLREAELARIVRRATDAPKAYDKFVQGMVHFERFTAEENARAYTLFREAIRIDPGYGKAYAMAAWTLVSDVWNERAPKPDDAMAEARTLLDRGFDADPNEPYMHWALGAYHLFAEEHDRSLSAFRKAIELNPNGADLRTYLGWAMVYAGRPAEGLAELEAAQALNPRHPGWYLWDIAFAKTFLGDYAGAARTLEAREPKTSGTHELLAVIYALDGKDQKAAAAVDRLLDLRPGFTIESRSQLEPFADEDDRKTYFDAMRAAGIPEN